MKKIRIIASLLMLIAVFAGCGKVENKTDTAVSTSLEEQNEDIGKTAVVYFSATGNTRAIAEMISKEMNADLFEIVPAQSYSDEDLDYNDNGCRANIEQNDDMSRPEIENDLSATEEYDVIYLGYPIWWGTVPRIIQTYLEEYDLNNATIYTFCTSGGSSIDRSISDLKKWYPSISIVDGTRLNNASQTDIANFCNR